MTSWFTSLYKQHHSDHDQTFTSLLQKAQKCNVKLNFDKLQYKQNEVDFCGETYATSGCKPASSKVLAITAMPSLKWSQQETSSVIHWYDQLLVKVFTQIVSACWAYQRIVKGPSSI